MHFSQVTSTMLALGAGLASAVDVRLYYSNDCSGNYLVCSNLGANVCCTGTSVSLYWVVNRSLDARGFAGGNCGELRSARRTSSSFCMPGTGVVYTGGRWVVPASLRVRDQDVCAAGVGKCDAVQKPDTLVLADGSKFKVVDLDNAKIEQLVRDFLPWGRRVCHAGLPANACLLDLPRRIDR
ncbi:hypothetical protein RB594_003322 [Gaeumannomyces avenae]